MDNSYVMIEFFSGIGGMRASLPPNLPIRKIIAYEINGVAIDVYKTNFQETELHLKLIEQLTQSDLDGRADIWTLSPPCQPFTGTFRAKHKDISDPRCAGFNHVIELLLSLKNPPKWIFLENVKRFHGSQMEGLWTAALKEQGYTWKNYLLSPHQMGIPNTRMRFYMLCERSDRFSGFRHKVCEHFPIIEDEVGEEGIKPIHHFLIKEESQNLNLYLSENILKKDWMKDLSIVDRNAKITYCFTSAYSRQLHQATGSILFDNGDEPEVELDRNQLESYGKYLRRFSPKELLNLFGFEADFKFPENLIYRLQWKLVGNSLSVFVVRKLMSELFIEV